MTDVAGLTLLDKLREASKNSLTWHPRSPAEALSFDAAMTIWPALPAVVALVEAAQHVRTVASERYGMESAEFYDAMGSLSAALAPFVGEET